MTPGKLVVVAGGATDEDAALASRQRARVVAGVLDAVPASLQEQPLLRIHELSFGRRDVEEARVEAVVLVERAKPLAVALARDDVAGLEELVEVPAIAGHAPDAVPPLGNVLPVLGEVPRLRELARHADDGNRLRRTVRAFGSREAGALPVPPRLAGLGDGHGRRNGWH